MAKRKKRVVVGSKVGTSRKRSSSRKKSKAPSFLSKMPATVRTLLAETVDLPTFRGTVGDLSAQDRKTLLEQASVLLEQNYVHLPLKSAMHAIDPVQRLNLLQDKNSGSGGELTDLEFHRELLSIFLSLRDLHTNYTLPAPFNRMIAFVPFFIEEFFEDGERQFMVSGTMNGFAEPPFGAGVEVLSWNGVPIARAVEINGDRFAGSNEDARRARGVETMTVRSLSGQLPPDEDFVLIKYRTTAGDEEELRVEWSVFSPDSADAFANAENAESASQLAMDEELYRVRDARKILFVPQVVDAERRYTEAAKVAAQGSLMPDLGLDSQLPEVIEAREQTTSSGTFGYVRIRIFFGRIPNFVERFLAEFIRLVNQLPREGLIIDVRGNGGGNITAGERLLQFLTPQRIQPEPAQLLNTPLNLRMAERNNFLHEWVPSIKQAVRSGATFSRGFPITSVDDANAIGQIYHGPVVLITDALCYSTTDIFAAGFQDHEVGPILGVDGNTGAGGANVFSHRDIVRFFFPDAPYRELPNGANMRVSIRRTLRVRDRAGEPVEEFGVIPDERHFMTRNDLLNSNADLLDRAGNLLADETVRQLDVEQSRDGDELVLSLTTRGIERIDVYDDGRPVGSVDIEEGETDLTVEAEPGSDLRLEGFEGSVLVASRKLNAS